MAAPLLPPLPQALTARGFPVGVYGIAHNISIRRTEDDLPDGWNSNRANTYQQLIRRLHCAGYVQHQYGDYRIHNTMASIAWATVASLRLINIPGKLEATGLTLEMDFVQDLSEMDVASALRLGGAFSTASMDVTAAGLVAAVPPGVLAPPPVIPGAVGSTSPYETISGSERS
ncbi:hypothetical protein BV22DRAFT_1033343 [Leucogyrophana mollusca]|uniref:Uncharacterized protein n=1 Tax=Leucogyrophana mollusca TaxID=85980 RepID=A0ACB8BK86_9AGAM|nr:hypothetical protein BV22DRAFT_1033343 [Leucogyrophana mollusca]